jgi:Secretion system C-terminal sorting domain/PKD domain
LYYTYLHYKLFLMRIFHLLALFIFITAKLAAQNCSVSVSYAVNGNTVVVTATPTNTSFPLYSWYDQTTNNFTTPSTSPTYTFTFPSNGVVYSCVLMVDSLSQCFDSTCFYIYQSPVCSASFYTFDSLNTTFFVNTSSFDSGSVFQWDFGDGGFSNDADPSYTYSTPGIYTACVYIWSPLSLMPCDSFCTQVQVNYISQTSVNEWAVLPGGVAVFPNPSADYVAVNWSQLQSGNAVITITDLTGRTISSVLNTVTTVGRQTVTLPVSQLPGGIYLLQVEDEQGRRAVSRLSIQPE